MTVPLPEHDHCKFCGNPIPFDMAYCSEECYYKYQAKIKKEKQNTMLFWGLAALSVIVIFAVKLIL
ncbi:MAG: DUF2116 family Zn-ribbon domain-containing protein [Candidatus Methanomethylophilaceae archaeon]|nr:DUF2116 family Zn-ribbon domain-containing protein [Candidatus Methanomethylophilaceae archaeon]MDD3379469.1 DUF2116 family Zn-ribbon domain-containing protein [Candidatus Methanomethylophilaceae archaeon]MDY0224365.1 DUF2116 family Zn-ribbon domain-containing protein [Candidatus Methanomethylophilaceae archaeon]